MSTLPITHTTTEVADAFKVSTDFLRDLVKAGKVTPLRMSSAANAPMRFTDEHVEQVKQAMTPPEPVRQRRRARRRSAP